MRSKFSALLSLIVVFLSGTLVGVFGYRLYMVNSVQGTAPATVRKFDPEEVRRRILADMKQKIQLDDQQVKQVNQILDQTRQRFRQIHDRLNTEGRAVHDEQIKEVQAILRPDQRPLYDTWRAQREAERHRHDHDQQKRP